MPDSFCGIICLKTRVLNIIIVTNAIAEKICNIYKIKIAIISEAYPGMRLFVFNFTYIMVLIPININIKMNKAALIITVSANTDIDCMPWIINDVKFICEVPKYLLPRLVGHKMYSTLVLSIVADKLFHIYDEYVNTLILSKGINEKFPNEILQPVKILNIIL